MHILTYLKKDPIESAVGIFIAVVLLMLLWHAFIWQPVFPAKEPEKYCEGTPLYVQYPYESGYLEPHACKVQCETPSEQRFVLYSNGKATQCEKIPGCLDAGEDSGVTCTVPDAYKMSSQETT